MKTEHKILVALSLWGLSLLPVFPDPFHPPEEKPVPFWVWLYKEVYEILHGEVETLPFSLYW